MADVTVAEALLGLSGSVAALPKLAPVKSVVSQSGCCLTPMGGEHADGDDDGSGSGSESESHLSDSDCECSLPPQAPPASQRFLVWHGCVPAAAPATAATPSPIAPGGSSGDALGGSSGDAPGGSSGDALGNSSGDALGNSSGDALGGSSGDAPDSSLFPWPAAAKALYVRRHQ